MRTDTRRWLEPPLTRYQVPWDAEFWNFVRKAMSPRIAILDVGSGRQPTIEPARRPDGVRYVGLDVSAAELDAAPPDAYDERVAADAETLVPTLVDQFDLIVSWLALEHIRRLDKAADAIYRYARPGGWFVACLSGRYAAFAIVNRLLPSGVGARFVAWLRDRPAETVFRAHYSHCTERGLSRVFTSWHELYIVPLWRGGGYFERVPLLQSLYLRYETWAMERGLTNLATYYVVAGRKAVASGYERDNHLS